MQYLKYKYTRKSINDKAKYGNYRKKSAGIDYICPPRDAPDDTTAIIL